MVLLFSEKSDITTNLVIDWLDYFGEEWLRINENENIEFFEVDGKIFFEIRNKQILFDEVKSVWYRRSTFKVQRFKSGNEGLNIYLSEEQYWYEDYINYKIKQKAIGICNKQMNVNKLIVNDIAKKIGFFIPKAYILTKKDMLPNNKKIITKTINGNGFIEYTENIVSQLFTKEITMDSVVSKFGMSYFQEEIDKKYELRIFYLRGEMWAMAIFSQNDEQTKVDFRHYNRERPNRTVPFSLPNELKVKINTLMDKMNLDTGSIDIIVDKDMKYYFLEINPVGQFGMVSFPCNFNIEKRIAEILAHGIENC